ncbi:type IV secretion system DNA-binding domain-containig protein [Flagellimonas hymeniacidonis]|uniref:Type IV secretion system DNA-binding domain-containig protein n=1 Tax=Flagellimonas hymeniacidonis TaxID=2603628 RepID=A0A5C8V6H0_9FLAO|nr:type IV secretion system DNA-binding domain-containing protein [Flagellimonas hymeniacidonis]TXN37704.1 type IV secretion system DNA-binding domain-containig protein [Flagellimonas hymeniacidonis]
MKILDTFFEASEITQMIIMGINVGFAVLMSFVFRPGNSVVKIIIAIMAYCGLFFGIGQLASYLPITYFVVLYILPSALLGLFLSVAYAVLKGPEKVMNVFDVEIPYNNGKRLRVNIKRGVSVQGAAGSGKTASVAGWILHWMGKRNVPSLVYDYKNFELVEAVQWFYRDSELPIHAFAPHDPDKSVFLNPIDPEVLKTDEDISLMCKCIVQNVIAKDGKGDNFFVQAAEGALIGVIYVLKEKYPQHCSFPYLAAIFLTKEAEGLVDFIEQSTTASIHARAFLDGKESEKQMAGVKATLSNAFRVFAVPNIFYTMQKSSVNLSINNKENLAVLCLVNIPKYDEIYSPILSIVTQAVITSMSERHQEPSYILLDEAPTLRINRIGKVPATMRSFDIATIYMLQDKVQAQIQMGVDKMKEVLANLSTLFFGKTNDPDTARFFESYFETVKVKTKSTSKKAGWGGADRRISEAEKDEKKHKSFEMFQRSAGQFFVFDEKGQNFDAKIKMPELQPMPYNTVNITTQREIQSVFNLILKKAKDL